MANIEIEKLNVRFDANHVLKDINIKIEEKKITAIIGPSGCGKSTFIRCINRMNDLIPTCTVDGRVVVDGQDIYEKGVDPTMVRKRIGMVFQKPNPFPKSVFENVAYAPKIHGKPSRKGADKIDKLAKKEVQDIVEWSQESGALGRGQGPTGQVGICALRGSAAKAVHSPHARNQAGDHPL